MKEKKMSEQIADFINLLGAAGSSYTYMAEKLTECNQRTQDILHALELDNLKYGERAKIATELQKVRRERRGYKDCVEELEPLAQYVAENKKTINQLRELLGAVRKIEKYHAKRRYFPRITVEADKPA